MQTFLKRIFCDSDAIIVSKCAFFFLIIAQFFEGLDFFQGAKNTLNARSFWKNSVKMSVFLVKAALKYL